MMMMMNVMGNNDELVDWQVIDGKDSELTSNDDIPPSYAEANRYSNCK